jgi:serine-type D-Ala-D-Ala carboxypeptidase/endopeptidase
MSRLVWIALSTAGLLTSNSFAQKTLPTDDAIRRIIAERVDVQGEGVGIVVGVIGPAGRHTISYGEIDEGIALDGDTVFEIGSLTKVFTSLLLADMVTAGEVALDDPVETLLPTDVSLPQRNGRKITLVDIATHTAGLPTMPDDFPPFNDVAASQYSVAELYRFLSRFELSRDIGAEHRYSNVGYSLLGYALAARAGASYESILRTRVLDPLNLTSTTLTLSPSLRARLAPGHDATSQRTAPFSFPMLAPAGGLASTANDLLGFLSVVLGREVSPLEPALSAMLDQRRPGAQVGNVQALGWMITGESDDQLIFHDGGTLGHASAVAWDPRQKLGVVVLANSVISVGDIARHLLRPSLPLDQPTATNQTEISVDATTLDDYVGRYEAAGGPFLIARENDFLTIALPASWGLPKLRLRAEGPRDFYTAELPIRITFQAGDNGRTSSLLIYPPRAQQAILATKIVLRSGQSI